MFRLTSFTPLLSWEKMRSRYLFPGFAVSALPPLYFPYHAHLPPSLSFSAIPLSPSLPLSSSQSLFLSSCRSNTISVPSITPFFLFYFSFLLLYIFFSLVFAPFTRSISRFCLSSAPPFSVFSFLDLLLYLFADLYSSVFSLFPRREPTRWPSG